MVISAGCPTPNLHGCTAPSLVSFDCWLQVQHGCNGSSIYIMLICARCLHKYSQLTQNVRSMGMIAHHLLETRSAKGSKHPMPRSRLRVYNVPCISSLKLESQYMQLQWSMTVWNTAWRCIGGEQQCGVRLPLATHYWSFLELRVDTLALALWLSVVAGGESV